MANKFDTNPLDPDFPERARSASATGEAASETVRLPNDTERPFAPPPSITEDETRRFSNSEFNAYAYSSPEAAAMYHPHNARMNRADEHKVAKVGLPERWLIGLPYVPFYIGLVAGLIMLLVIPKEENKVRFHAAQGLAAHVAILAVIAILGVIGNFTNIANIGSNAFSIVATVMLLIFAFKAWKGKPVHIAAVDDLTNWLEEKIGPLK